MDHSFITDFEEIEQVQRQLGVAMAQLSTTLKHFEVVYGSISKLHSLKRQMYIDSELLMEEREKMKLERIQWQEEKDELILLKKEIEGLQIEHTADTLLTVLKKQQTPEISKSVVESDDSASESTDGQSMNSNISANTYSQVGVQTALNLFQNASQKVQTFLKETPKD